MKSVSIVLSSNKSAYLRKIKGSYGIVKITDEQKGQEINSLKGKIY